MVYSRKVKRALTVARFAGRCIERQVAACVVLAVSPALAASQSMPVTETINAGSEMERYLRVLTLVGKAQSTQWTVRALGPSEVARISPAVHPWRKQSSEIASAKSRRASITAPSIGLVYNSSHPYGFNDGPVWASKGATAVASGGATFARGPFSLTAHPIAFITQNADFAIAENGLTDSRRFADWSFPNEIDRPQRFGSSAYGRIDPGESEVRVEGHGLAAGLSTRAEFWGPASSHPMILGNNAGGFPRLFAGTRQPVDARWVTLHGRVLWGVLHATRFGPDTGTSRRHFATAAIGTVGIKGIPGLELGGSRFFHTSWPQGGLGNAPWLRVVQEIVRIGSSDPTVGFNPDNQIASAFFRLGPQGKGFEVYGEFGREDRNASFRDFLLEPDHIGAYLLGFMRAFPAADDSRITVIRGEVLNTRISHLQQQRPQTPWYTHGAQRHGHTSRGQELGSAGGFGGGASVVAVDRYTPSGRATIRWDRIATATPLNADGLPISAETDVSHAITYERAIFTQRGEMTAAAGLVKEFNRHFGADALNANFRLTYRLLR